MIAIIYQKPYELNKKLKSTLVYLRKEYLKSSREKNKNEKDMVISDNFYLIERECVDTIKQLKKCPAIETEKNLPRAFLVCRKIIKDGRLLSISEIEMILLESKLKITDFELLPAFFRVVIIENIKIYTRLNESEKLKNSVMALRRIDEIDFEKLTKKCSAVERALNGDSTGVYPKMSEKTKYLYRHAILKNALSEKVSEESIAEFAKECSLKEGRHIGEFIDLPKEKKWLGSVMIFSQILLSLAISVTISALLQKVYIAFVLFLPLWEALRPLTERFFMLFSKQKILPQINLKGVIDETARTLVVLSALLSESENAEEFEHKLRSLKVSNPYGAVDFILLADLKASDKPLTNEDIKSVRAVEKIIDKLNEEFGGSFMFAVRPRMYSRTQRIYCGQERKRGAISELIKKIKGEKCSFLSFYGDDKNIENTKYIMVLDWDTQMELDALPELVGAAIHPLNRPKIKDGRVVSGYGIISPSVQVNIESAQQNVFTSFLSGSGGISVYDEFLSNLYFDLFGESTFSGKGLIDVEAYYQLVDGIIPNEKILSHDSIESGLLRTAFLSQAQVLDDFPKNEKNFLSRFDRWTRGDWQNLIFLFSRISGRKNPINTLTKYKLFDNVRRAITVSFSALLLLLSVFELPSVRALFIAVAILSTCGGYLLSILNTIFIGIKAIISKQYFSNIKPDTEENLKKAFAEMFMLPAKAFVSFESACKSLWRMLVTRKNLLQWTTAGESEKSAKRNFFKNQLPCIIFSLLLILSIKPSLIFLGLFFLSGAVFLEKSSDKRLKNEPQLSNSEREKIISWARKEWNYYSRYCNEKSNWLPPDNVQETPCFEVAYRTSPTNIGMYMLCILAAKDFEFISIDEMIKRLSGALKSIEKLEKYEGNLFNWYDVKNLKTLEPRFISSVDSGNFLCCLIALKEGLKAFDKENPKLLRIIKRLENIIDTASLKPLYNKKKNLFHIGFDVEKAEPSDCYYDLIMSEARMTGFFAVATRQVPKKHWAALGRIVSKFYDLSGVLSWSGTMFEYYMPHILLPVYKSSLIWDSLKYCLLCQMKRSEKATGVWGISESAFYAFDMKMNYLYKAHGVQKTGLRRGLNSELVISPYSSCLTLPFSTKKSFQNLIRLEEMGALGECGFYEAVDFTQKRLSPRRFAIVKSYMAHHAGMSLLSMANAVFGNIMQKRFIADDRMNSAKLLLQEKFPKSSAIFKYADSSEKNRKTDKEENMIMCIENINLSSPRVHILSNGEWTSIITDSGISRSLYNGFDMTRQEGDTFFKPYGIFAVVETEDFTMPLMKCIDNNTDTHFQAEFREKEAVIFSQKEYLKCKSYDRLSENEPCEVRTFKMKNLLKKELKCRLIIYLEPSLTFAATEKSHPAFSNMFVEPETDEENKIILFRRKGEEKNQVSMALALDDGVLFDYSFSRGEILERPLGAKSLLRKGIVFGKSVGSADYCCAFGVNLTLKAEEERDVNLFISASLTDENAKAALMKFRRGFKSGKENFACTMFPQWSLDGITADRALPHIFFYGIKSKEKSECSKLNEESVEALWSMGISGDNPIMLVKVYSVEDMQRALPYININKMLHRAGIKTDVAILCLAAESEEEISAELNNILFQAEYIDAYSVNGGVHLLFESKTSDRQRNALTAYSSYIASNNAERMVIPPKPFEQIEILSVEKDDKIVFEGEKIIGGIFTDKAFTVTEKPPKPWCNILCNDCFGTLVSDMALGYTWGLNSRENKLTEWKNDSSYDNRGEMILLRVDGKVYDALWGSYAEFSENKARYYGKINSLETRVEVSVDDSSMSKRVRVGLKNNSNLIKSIEAVYYTEPVLAWHKDFSAFIKAEKNADSLTMHNPFPNRFKGYMNLKAVNGMDFYCCDKAEFLNGNWKDKALLPLPCGCASVGKYIRLPARNEDEIEFVLSYAIDKNAVEKMSEKGVEEKENALTVTTPDKELNAMINTFLPMQIKNSRIKGRTGFYQCGGAYGFRDQLQDVASLILTDAEIVKEQICRCCYVQFSEGDVMHWWHEIYGSEKNINGVRTRCSDDLLWLPLTVAEYVKATGDLSILEIEIPFIEGTALTENEKDIYFATTASQEKTSVFEHCVRAVEHSLEFGKHSLPLIKSGDWCDGYSSVGIKGYGESVWLADFMVIVLDNFSKLCSEYGKQTLADKYARIKEELKLNIEQSAWDGEWYIRAYYDDGEKMGANGNKECAIDLLPQAFSSLADLDENRVNRALTAVEELLVDEETGVIKLFTPPFSKLSKKAGYINNYPSGVRENAGQYTHSALWFCIALIKEKRVDEAYNYLKMLNPMNKYKDKATALKYALEPYAMAADVSDKGVGGWSQYTGSAAWYYRCVVEYLLGIKKEKGRLYISPSLPSEWLGFSAKLVLDGAEISVEVKKADEKVMFVDESKAEYITLDGKDHKVTLNL
ncbi:MAG: hypothetical protein K5917_05255 [Clostridiales bacterium]|nr:hypothetical protein [Clostridiales bacterium]